MGFVRGGSRGNSSGRGGYRGDARNANFLKNYYTVTKKIVNININI